MSEKFLSGSGGSLANGLKSVQEKESGSEVTACWYFKTQVVSVERGLSGSRFLIAGELSWVMAQGFWVDIPIKKHYQQSPTRQ
jgi:hypothetical protein